jgi:hypothetical protein
MLVELTGRREREQSVDRPASVAHLGQKQEIRPGPGGQAGPAAHLALAEDVKRVGDRDSFESRLAQQPIGGRLERGRETTESRVDSVSDHDAGDTGVDSGLEAGELPAAEDPTHPRDVGRPRRRTETREMLGAGSRTSRGQAARKGDRARGGGKVAPPKRPVRRIEDRSKINVDTRPPERATGRPALAEGLLRAGQPSCG